jgi:hypothetical protein
MKAPYSDKLETSQVIQPNIEQYKGTRENDYSNKNMDIKIHREHIERHKGK